MTVPMGFQGQVALSSTSSFSSTSKWLQIQSESIKRQGNILDADGVRGSRSKDSSRVRTGPYKVGGSITQYCDIDMLDVWLSYVLGTGTSHAYTLTDALSSFYLMIDRKTAVFVYGPCYVSKATFSAAAGTGEQAFLKMVLDIEAETETVESAGTFPSGMTVDTNRPYQFADSNSAIEFGSTALGAESFEVTIDNHLLADRFLNELTRSAIPTMDRTVSFKMGTQYTSVEAAYYGVAVGSFGTASAVFTSTEEASSVLTFSMPGLLQYPTISPTIQSKQSEIKLEFDGIARAVAGSDLEIAITNAQ